MTCRSTHEDQVEGERKLYVKVFTLLTSVNRQCRSSVHFLPLLFGTHQSQKSMALIPSPTLSHREGTFTSRTREGRVDSGEAICLRSKPFVPPMLKSREDIWDPFWYSGIGGLLNNGLYKVISHTAKCRRTMRGTSPKKQTGTSSLPPKVKRRMKPLSPPVRNVSGH